MKAHFGAIQNGQQTFARSVPAERQGKACISNFFNVQVSFAPPDLIIDVETDLPLSTKIRIEATRTFPITDGGRWNWTLLEEILAVTYLENGGRGIRLSRSLDQLDTKGLNSYRYLKGQMRITIAGRPSEEVEIRIEAPVAQHQFGLSNRRLTGLAVTLHKSGNFIERECKLSLPLSQTVMETMKM